MSVQSEIQRLKNAKSNIIAAIAEKGVSVPSSTTLDGVADYISEIESGSAPVKVGPTWKELVSPETDTFTKLRTNNVYYFPSDFSLFYSFDGINYGAVAEVVGRHCVASKDQWGLTMATGGYMSDFDYTEDGINWHLNYQPDLGIENHFCINNCFYFKNKFIIAVDINPSGYDIDSSTCFYHSTDLQEWTEGNNGNFLSTAIGYDNNVMVAGSQDGVYYSMDGDIWIPIEQNFSMEGYIHTICKTNDIWFMLTRQGDLYFSTDLLELQQINIGNMQLTGITYSNGLYYLSTYGGLYTSSDLNIWTLQREGDFEAIASIDNKIILAETYKVFYSNDGETWHDITKNVWPEYQFVDGLEGLVTDIKVFDEAFYIMGQGIVVSWWEY